jgi:hypothetical protein
MQKIYLSDAGPKVSPAVYGFYRWDINQSNSLSVMEENCKPLPGAWDKYF